MVAERPVWIPAVSDDSSGFDLGILALFTYSLEAWTAVWLNCWELGEFASDRLIAQVGDRNLEVALEKFQLYSCGAVALTVIYPCVAGSA